MRACNLSLLSNYFGVFSDSELNDKVFKRFGIKVKDREKKSIKELVSRFASENHELETYELLDDCFVGFVIPQIGKEFDCLWIGKKSIVNIELKSQPIATDDIVGQLIKNRKYLGALKRDSISLYTFESQTGTCYSIGEDDYLRQVPFSAMVQSLENLKKTDEILSGNSIDFLFEPCDYLVSPFNSTSEFLDGKYFLTNEQETVKKEILKLIKSCDSCSLAITGPAGSGKTLLLYDIARTLALNGIKVGIAHCGSLNEGHYRLMDKGWLIKKSEDYRQLYIDLSTRIDKSKVDMTDIDVLLIDEAQRDFFVSKSIDSVKEQKKHLILSYDPIQCLKDDEKKYNIDDVVKDKVDKLFTLKASIRTNGDLRGFIKALFNTKQPHKQVEVNCIDVTYCSTQYELQNTLKTLTGKGVVVPKFTPSKDGYEPFYYEKWFLGSGDVSAHQVIGQEFDAVACVLGPSLRYTDGGSLESSRTQKVYSEVDMLYQIMSRAKKKLHVVVFDNKTMYFRCLDLLSK